MKKAIADKWIKALRSGKYKQGKRLLKNFKGEYCCLGVLAEICGYKYISQDCSYVFDEYECLTSRSDFLGNELKSALGMLPNYSELGSLAEANDANMSFKKIAKLIEKHWRYL